MSANSENREVENREKNETEAGLGILPRRTLTALLVEPDEARRKNFCWDLEAENYEVIEARSAQEVYEIVEIVKHRDRSEFPDLDLILIHQIIGEGHVGSDLAEYLRTEGAFDNRFAAPIIVYSKGRFESEHSKRKWVEGRYNIHVCEEIEKVDDIFSERVSKRDLRRGKKPKIGIIGLGEVGRATLQEIILYNLSAGGIIGGKAICPGVADKEKERSHEKIKTQIDQIKAAMGDTCPMPHFEIAQHPEQFRECDIIIYLASYATRNAKRIAAERTNRTQDLRNALSDYDLPIANNIFLALQNAGVNPSAIIQGANPAEMVMSVGVSCGYAEELFVGPAPETSRTAMRLNRVRRKHPELNELNDPYISVYGAHHIREVGIDEEISGFMSKDGSGWISLKDTPMFENELIRELLEELGLEGFKLAYEDEHRLHTSALETGRQIRILIERMFWGTMFETFNPRRESGPFRYHPHSAVMYCTTRNGTRAPLLHPVAFGPYDKKEKRIRVVADTSCISDSAYKPNLKCIPALENIAKKYRRIDKKIRSEYGKKILDLPVLK